MALRRAEWNLRQSVHTLASRSPRRTRIVRGRSKASPFVPEGERSVVQAAVLFAGALPDLLPGGAEGKCHVSGSVTTPDCDRAASGDRDPPDGTVTDLVVLWRWRRASGRYPAGLLRVSDRVHPQPTRPALRHRSG